MEPTDLENQQTPGLPEQTAPSFLQRVIWLFSAPSKIFVPPRDFTLWLIPLLIISGLNVTYSLLLKDLYLEQQRDFFRSSTMIPEDQKEEMLQQLDEQQENSSPGMMVAQTAGGIVLSAAMIFFLPALFYFLILNFGLGAQSRYGEILGVVTFSTLLIAAREILTLPLKISQGTLDVFTSPAAFVSQDAGLLFQICNVFDVFHLYRLFVLAVGFAIVGRVSLRSAGILVVAVWAVWSMIWILIKMSPIGPVLPALMP